MTNPLKEFRKNHQPRRLSQQKLAEMCGVTRETVARWEAGRNIDLDFLPVVSRVTSIPAAKLRPDVAAKFETVEVAA
jgi:transcriptional regulator with XRE-family HTH domain